jgi:hypothetical protein
VRDEEDCERVSRVGEDEGRSRGGGGVAAAAAAAPPLAHVPPPERPPPVPRDLPVPSAFAGDLPGLRKQLRSLALLSQARRKGTKAKAFVGNRGHLQYSPKPSWVPESCAWDAQSLQHWSRAHVERAVAALNDELAAARREDDDKFGAPPSPAANGNGNGENGNGSGRPQRHAAGGVGGGGGRGGTSGSE